MLDVVANELVSVQGDTHCRVVCNHRASLLLYTRADTNQAAVPTWLASKVIVNGKESTWAVASWYPTRARAAASVPSRTKCVGFFSKLKWLLQGTSQLANFDPHFGREDSHFLEHDLMDDTFISESVRFIWASS